MFANVSQKLPSNMNFMLIIKEKKLPNPQILPPPTTSDPGNTSFHE